MKTETSGRPQEIDNVFDRMRAECAARESAAQGADYACAAEPPRVPLEQNQRQTLSTMTGRKAEVMRILSQWKVAANINKKKSAEADCDTVIAFINSICAW